MLFVWLFVCESCESGWLFACLCLLVCERELSDCVWVLFVWLFCVWVLFGCVWNLFGYICGCCLVVCVGVCCIVVREGVLFV